MNSETKGHTPMKISVINKLWTSEVQWICHELYWIIPGKSLILMNHKQPVNISEL
jgi:hypothetical protein